MKVILSNPEYKQKFDQKWQDLNDQNIEGQ